MRGIAKFVLIGLGIVFLYFVNGLAGKAAATIGAGMFFPLPRSFVMPNFTRSKLAFFCPHEPAQLGAFFVLIGSIYL